EQPADPGDTAVETHVQGRGGIAGQLFPASALGSDVSQPAPGLTGDLAVLAVARRPGGLKVDPGDPGDAELETGARPGTAVACKRPARPSRRIRHRLVVDPGEQPTRGREINGITITPVALEEHVR